MRLKIRKIYNKIELDDYIIGINIIFIITYFTSAFLLLSNNNISYKTGVILYYIASINYYITIWFTKISILISYKRIMPTYEKIKIINIIACIFFIILCFLIIEEIFICTKQDNFGNYQHTLCTLGDLGAFSQLICNIISDIILFYIPLPLIYKSNLSIFNKLRLGITFGCILIITIIGIIHNIQQIKINNSGEILWAFIETTVSAIVCCLPIIYVYILSFLNKKYIIFNNDENTSSYKDLELSVINDNNNKK